MIIRAARPEDYPSLKHIAEVKFGKDFAGEDQFFENGLLCLVAEIDGTVVAYATACIVDSETKSHLEEYFDGKTGLLSSLAVLPEFERRKIGTMLAKERVKRLKEVGCDSVIATAWRSEEGGVHVGKILDRLGFKPIDELLKYWEGNDCVFCGDYCTCDAVVYKLKF